MITLFRKIRKQLLNTDKTTKYLLYAIGEIALVVIGILIALQINNWNEWRQERSIEKIVLGDIEDNLRRNADQIEAALQMLDSMDYSCQVILSALERDLPYSDDFSPHFHRSQFNGSIFLNLSVDGYESLKSAAFNIIRSEMLKDAILNLYESEYKKLERIIDWQLGVLTNNDQLFQKHFIRNTSRTYIPKNFDALKDDVDYFSLLIRIRGERMLSKQTQMQSLAETNRVHKLIENELLKLEKY